MADITVAQVVFHVPDTAVGTTFDVTIPGFGTPKAAVFRTSGADVADTPSAHGRINYGYYDGTNQACTSFISRSANGTSVTQKVTRNDAVISFISTSNDVETSRFSAQQFITDGVRIEVDNDDPTPRAVTLTLIGGADVTPYVGTRQVAFNTLGDKAITGVGFQPNVLFMSAASNTTLNTIATTSQGSFGVAVDTGAVIQQKSVSWTARNIVTTTSNVSTVGTQLVTLVNAAAVEIEYRAALTSFDPDGFTLNVDNTASSARYVAFLALNVTGDPNLSVFSVTIPSAGDYVETGPGAPAQYGLVYTNQGVTAEDAVANSGNIALTASSVGDVLSSESYTDQDNVGTTNSQGWYSEEFAGLSNDGVAELYRASGVSVTPVGWTATMTTNPATDLLGFGFALAGGASAGPTIDTQPTPQTVAGGDDATFSVSATSSGGTLTYQWREDLIAIPGATSATYIKTNCLEGDDGKSYDVLVSDDNGQTPSDQVLLTVNAAISFDGKVSNYGGVEGKTFTSRSVGPAFGGNIAPITFADTGVALPVGVSMAADGTLSGSLAAVGSTTGHTATGTDGDANAAVSNSFQVYATAEPTESFVSPALTNAQQGYAWDGTFHYIFNNSTLTKRNDDGTWSVAEENTSPTASAIGTADKLNDGTVYNGYVYVGALNNSTKADKQIMRFLASDLSFVDAFIVPHPAASLTIDSENSEIYLVDFWSSLITVVDLVTYAYKRSIYPNPELLSVQGIYYRDGNLYLLDTDGELFIVDPESGDVVWSYQTLGSYTEWEGIDYSADEFRYMVKEDVSTFKVHYLDGVPGVQVVQWDGPSIIDQGGTENDFFLFDDNGDGNVASRFSGTGAPFVYAVSPISQPFPDGVQVNGVTGNPFGRPIEDGTFLGLVISAGEDEPAELFTDIATISNATWDDTTLTLNGSNATAQLIGTPVNGTDYHYVFDYDVPDGTICYLRFGGGANQAFMTGPATGTFNAVYPATGTDYLMQIATDTGGPSTFNNFSVKEYSESAGSANSNSFTMTVAAAVGIQDMYVKDGGVFKQATPYIKEGGVFVAADAYVRSGGAWVKVQDK